MKHFLSIFTILCFSTAFPQDSQQAPPNTEVFLFDLISENGKVTLANVKNVSNNEGYDNQPYFLDDTYLLFSSNRNGQTDIAKYYMTYDSKSWLNFSPGSEYSPIKIPGQDSVSAINLSQDGSQKLFKYSLSTGEGQMLIDDIVIGYQLWYDEETLISSVLENDMLNLYMTDISSGKHTKLEENVGRSLHRIPDSDLISFISKANDGQWQIKSMDLNRSRSKMIMNTLEGSEDMIWMANGTILMAKDSKIYKNSGNTWKEWVDLKQNGIGKITRLALNEDNSKLAIAAELSGALISNNDDRETTETPSSGEVSINNTVTATKAAEVVQSHIKPYNNNDLEGFLEPFAEDVLVSRFPSEIISNGKDKMRQGYANHFKNNKNLSVKVNKRIALKNFVIDEELVTQNTETHRQATIYIVENDKIKSMTFISNSPAQPYAEKLVNEQLEAYNRRDIDGFMAPYANDVKLYNYPDELRTEGAEAVKNNYSQFFERTPDLRGVVQNRIIIGNKIIDQEHVTINGQLLNAVAIYEIENGKIIKVTFIQ